MSGQKQSSETVDGTAEEIGPEPDLKPAVDELLPVAVRDPHDEHELMVRMDEADVQMLLSWATGQTLKRWVYQLPHGKGEGLTVHAVQDIVQRMNWTGKAQIGLLLDEGGRPVLDVETVEADEGQGPELFWAVTAYAKDEATGMVLPGASMEPQRMKKRDGSRVFDRFARWKAIQKATRNALSAHIPEEVEQAVIGLALKDPGRVERIRTEAEAKLDELPPPLDDDEARALIARSREIQDEIAALGAEAVMECPPGLVGSYRMRSQHSHEMLRDFIAWLEKRRDELAEKYGSESSR